jgi:hypothetical protein
VDDTICIQGRSPCLDQATAASLTFDAFEDDLWGMIASERTIQTVFADHTNREASIKIGLIIGLRNLIV